MLSELAQITVNASAASGLRRAAGEWRLSRAWPKRTGHLLLEFVDPLGMTMAGQWLADQTRLDRICHETARISRGQACIVRVRGGGVLLQSEGADRRLSGVARVRELLQSTALLVHRPERRAVVRGQLDNETVYAKVTRPGPSTIASIHAGELAARSSLLDSVSTPRLVRAEPDHGVAIWSEVPGISLHDRLAAHTPPHSDEVEHIARAVGVALTQIHTADPMPTQPVHTANDEAAMLMRWLDHLRWACPDRAGAIAPLIASICGRLASLPPRHAPIHRDLHDKQILIDHQGRLGMIDFDTLATGDPALDLGNLIAHARLRVVQGLWPLRIAEQFIAALLDSTKPDADARARLDIWTEATSIRLACLYLFRPRWSQLVFARMAPLAQTETVLP
jgi:Phosphotransferase enzyme family